LAAGVGRRLLRWMSGLPIGAHATLSRELVAVPEGAKLLAFEKDTDDYNHDDEAGDAQTACRSEISYERDRQGRLQAIDARTSCTENGKSKPPIKATRFEWNVREKRFLQRKGDEKSD